MAVWAIRAKPVRGGWSRESGERGVAPAARWRADVASSEFHPRVRVGRARVRRQADHELNLVALLAEEPVEDERPDEAARPVGADVQGPVHGPAEQGRRLDALARRCPAKVSRELRQRLAAEPPLHQDERPPHPECESDLRTQPEGTVRAGVGRQGSPR